MRISIDLARAVDLGLPALNRHRLVTVNLDGLAEALAGSSVRLSSMGRGLDADLGYFLAAAAAGRHAAALLGGRLGDGRTVRPG